MLYSNGKINEELAILEKQLIKNEYLRKCITKYGKEHLKDDKPSIVSKRPVFYVPSDQEGAEISRKIDGRVTAALKKASLLFIWLHYTIPSVFRTTQR